MSRATTFVLVGLALLLATASGAAAHLGQPETYRWVEPPPAFAASNQAPAARRAALFRSAGATSIWTDDVQALIVVPDDAFRDVETVWVEIEPLGPSALPPPPAGLSPTGNAYRVGIFDGRGGAPLSLAGTGMRLVLSVPHEPAAVARLDNDTWTTGDAAPALPQGFSTPLDSDGPAIYLAMVSHKRSGTVGTVTVIGSTVALVAALGAVMLRRRSSGHGRTSSV